MRQSSSEADYTCIYLRPGQSLAEKDPRVSFPDGIWQAGSDMREQQRALISMPLGPGNQQYRINRTSNDRHSARTVIGELVLRYVIPSRAPDWMRWPLEISCWDVRWVHLRGTTPVSGQCRCSDVVAGNHCGTGSPVPARAAEAPDHGGYQLPVACSPASPA